MTLAELANLICTEVNQTEAEDVSACKEFLKRAFAILWQAALWKDSLFEYTQTIGAAEDYAVTDTWLPTKQVLICPADISHVLALRTDQNKLNVESSELFYRSDFDQFAASGTPRNYRLLPAVAWEFDTAQTLYRRNLSAADVALSVIVDVFHPATNARERVTGTSLGSIDRIDSFTKVATAAAVAIGQTFTLVNSYGSQVGVAVNGNDDDDFTYLNDGQSTALDVNEGDTIYLANANPASGGQIVSELVGTTGVNTVTSPFGTLTFHADLSRTFVAGTQILTLAAADTALARRQRLQIFGSVLEGTVLRVLGKVKAPTFEEDNDEPALTGCEDCLIAFAQARMLRRERQYNKAAAMMAEATALLDQLKKEQTVQQAHNKRLVPEDGYNDDWSWKQGGLADVKNW